MVFDPNCMCFYYTCPIIAVIPIQVPSNIIIINKIY